jgi:hypothetical protein
MIALIAKRRITFAGYTLAPYLGARWRARAGPSAKARRESRDSAALVGV